MTPDVLLGKYGPWAVVAGGSEGVGAAVARQLSAAGLGVVLLARSETALEGTAAEIREAGGDVRTLAVDLTTPDAVARIREVTDDLDVGVLVHNAGANTHGTTFLDGTLEDAQRVVDLNITSQLHLIHHFAGRMRDAGRGCVLTVGSLSGYLGHHRQSLYSASKAFARIFAESLWLELRDHGVDVLHVVLGVTRTPAMERAGLSFDIPGLVISEPEDVAAEALAHLDTGPVHVIESNVALVARQSGPDRARIVAGSHAMMSKLLPPERR